MLSTNVLFGVQSVYLKDKGMTGMYYDYAMATPFMSGINEKDELIRDEVQYFRSIYETEGIRGLLNEL